jgi:hypothetical protein
MTQKRLKIWITQNSAFSDLRMLEEFPKFARFVDTKYLADIPNDNAKIL